MATTILGHMKDTGGRNPSLHLKQSIEYILNPEKTGNGKYVGAGNCLVDTAYETMVDTKRLFGKMRGRQGYHFVLSFPKDDNVDESLCQKIVAEFAERYLQDRYEYVYAVHNNTDHMHAHLVFNSINRFDGKKYRYEKGDWAKFIQPITNEICKKYSLKEIAFETADGIYKPKRERVMEQTEQIKRVSNSYYEFIENLKNAGFVIRGKKYISVQPEGKGAKYRIGLQEDYVNYFKTAIFTETKKSSRHKSENKMSVGKVDLEVPDDKTELKVYWTKQNTARKNRTEGDKNAWKYKQQLRQFARTQQQIDYLFQMDIKTLTELAKREMYLEHLYKELMKERHRIYRKRYPYKEILRVTEQLQNLETYEKAFVQGMPFEAEHAAWENGIKQLAEAGVSYQEAIEMKQRFDTKLNEITEKRKMITKEQKLLTQIKEESRKQTITVQDHAAGKEGEIIDKAGTRKIN